MSDIPLPPFEYQTLVCGPGDEHRFEWAGHFLQDLLSRAGMLEAGRAFLDVGCGCGRIARILMDEPIGAYDGFDRHQGMIAWCNEVLAPRDARFHFRHVSVRSAYSAWDQQGGDVDADAFVFPYEDDSFDSILVASVFTHMPTPEVVQYLRELRRVLRPQGKILLSVFYVDGPQILKDEINYFYNPKEFLELLSVQGLHTTPVTRQLLYGYQHNWYVITHALPDRGDPISFPAGPQWAPPVTPVEPGSPQR
jgi:ubiquinone/menaquinone biosynthesis C-methylase UbiE